MATKANISSEQVLDTARSEVESLGYRTEVFETWATWVWDDTDTDDIAGQFVSWLSGGYDDKSRLEAIEYDGIDAADVDEYLGARADVLTLYGIDGLHAYEAYVHAAVFDGQTNASPGYTYEPFTEAYVGTFPDYESFAKYVWETEHNDVDVPESFVDAIDWAAAGYDLMDERNGFVTFGDCGADFAVFRVW